MNNTTLPRTLTELFPGFLSIGGMLSVVPEMHRYVVDVRHWITPADFIQMFAVGQAAPGLNVLVARLVDRERAVRTTHQMEFDWQYAVH